MSQENVDVVRGRVWDGIDAVSVISDDTAFAEWLAENEAFYEPDCAFAWMAFGRQLEATGLDEARRTWLDFFEPWQSVHSRVERLIPAGDKVVALMRQRGRMAGGRDEVQLIGAAVYLVRDGRIARGGAATDCAPP
jgi:ketosteroid isomerase-like protein